MSFILDQKTNLGSMIVPTGANAMVQVFSEFEVKPVNSENSYFSILNTGDINIGGNDTVTNITIEAAVKFNFKQIFDDVSEYLLTDTDYNIEIMNDNINTVLLPLSLNRGGRTYIISRRSNNNNLVIKAQIGDDIDNRVDLLLFKKGMHVNLYSNNANSWYVI